MVLVKRKTRTRRLSSINFMLVPDRQGPQPMATILAYTSPAFGNLFPILALMIELQRRGHRVVLKTLDDGVTIGVAGGNEEGVDSCFARGVTERSLVSMPGTINRPMPLAKAAAITFLRSAANCRICT